MQKLTHSDLFKKYYINFIKYSKIIQYKTALVKELASLTINFINIDNTANLVNINSCTLSSIDFTVIKKNTL